jgi:hypothetical protein
MGLSVYGFMGSGGVEEQRTKNYEQRTKNDEQKNKER